MLLAILIDVNQSLYNNFKCYLPYIDPTALSSAINFRVSFDNVRSVFAFVSYENKLRCNLVPGNVFISIQYNSYHTHNKLTASMLIIYKLVNSVNVRT